MPVIPQMSKKGNLIITQKEAQHLIQKVFKHIEEAQGMVLRTVNHMMVRTYWLIGREIVLTEQKGQKRASYGAAIIKTLSQALTQQFGKGYTTTNLKYFRQFYLTYSQIPIGHALRDQSPIGPDIPLNPNLSWTHYRLLMQVKNDLARAFYEKETLNNRWSARELERQINSLLFERLAKSKDKKGLLKLAYEGQEITTFQDAMKDPYVLEFLNLPESSRLTESDLEDALLNNLQAFLLELGKGFAFIARQQRLTLEGDHLYVDLVFYHTILKCYILIDLKIHKLTHGDIGQMLNYVNYYDMEIKNKDDNPTIGLILCTEKNEAQVRYTLAGDKRKIFTSKYQLYLPTEEELIKEMKKEMRFITTSKIAKFRKKH